MRVSTSLKNPCSYSGSCSRGFDVVVRLNDGSISGRVQTQGSEPTPSVPPGPTLHIRSRCWHRWLYFWRCCGSVKGQPILSTFASALLTHSFNLPASLSPKFLRRSEIGRPLLRAYNPIRLGHNTGGISLVSGHGIKVVRGTIAVETIKKKGTASRVRVQLSSNSVIRIPKVSQWVIRLRNDRRIK